MSSQHNTPDTLFLRSPTRLVSRSALQTRENPAVQSPDVAAFRAFGTEPVAPRFEAILKTIADRQSVQTTSFFTDIHGRALHLGDTAKPVLKASLSDRIISALPYILGLILAGTIFVAGGTHWIF